MARTKQTARKSSGGKAPRRMLQASSANQFRQFMTSQQQATYAGTSSSQEKTSYLNYENMFYSYSFPTGAPATVPFEPRFTAGGGLNPVSGEKEQWVGMSFNSMYDGEGMKVHGRPHLNLAIVLDISGSMSSSFDQEFTFAAPRLSKLDVAKTCLESLTKQLKPRDKFGLVRFNNRAEVHCPMKTWGAVNSSKLRQEIGNLKAYGTTCLSAAIDSATAMFRSVGESSHASNRVIFLTDLCSTVDSVNDEKRLLETIKNNASRGIYTTVVGIGMDLNVRLVEEISKTRGAKYCSVDSAEEFQRITNLEFDYDVTILAFNIRVELLTPQYFFAKGYGSPELNNIKADKPVVLSSEFPCWKDEKGETKGGMFLFKLDNKKGARKPPSVIKIKVTWEDLSGVNHSTTRSVKLSETFQDNGTRKAALLVHYVDLHNDYVHDRRRNKVKFLELFQSFRSHFVRELEEMKDKSLATSNQGDLQLLDKIIELESNPQSSQQPGPSSAFGFTFGSSGAFPGFGSASLTPNPPGPSFTFGSSSFRTPPPSLHQRKQVTFRGTRTAPVPKRLQRKPAARTPAQRPQAKPKPSTPSTLPARRSRRLEAQQLSTPVAPVGQRRSAATHADGVSTAKRPRPQHPRASQRGRKSRVKGKRV